MVFTRSLRTTLKALVQLGPESPTLYALYWVGLRTGHYKREERRLAANARPIANVHLPIPLPDQAQLLRVLGKDGKAALLKEADEIAGGRVRIFGAGPVPLVLAFKGPLEHWTAYVTNDAALPIHPSKHSQYADLKFVWEPARFGWAFALGRAYTVSGNEKYAAAFWRHFEKFDKGNPPYLGPHWMNGQEVALRLMALVWSAQVFAGSPASNPARVQRLAESIAQHAARIPETLVYARSQNNNHLITESAGLYTAGVALDHQPWRDLGWHWLNLGLQRQISSYGEYIQHSTNYHRLMLQSALWVDAIRRARHEVWPRATLEALMRASHWLFSMIDPGTGRAPNLGANDGSLILPLGSAPFDDYRPTVQAAARAFLRTSLPAGAWDELSVWLSLPPAKHTADSRAYAADQLRGRNSWAYLRASRFKSRLAHMDQLHLDLWWRGLNITRDPGTYLYSAPAPWDNPLVTTRVHNTVTVDGRDQMTRGGRFMTLDWCPAYSRNLLAVDHHVLGRMLAYHRGFEHLGVRHERLASVFDDGRWEIKDNLIFLRAGKHVFRLHWLLPNGQWRLDEGGSRVQLRLGTPAGRITLNVSGSEFLIWEPRVVLVRAGEVLHGHGAAYAYEGWFSPTYGQKAAALSLAVEVTSSRTCSLVTEFIFPR